MAETLGQLLPVYVLADESGSMTNYVGDLNEGMKSLHVALLGEPMAAAKVRFSVLGFANSVTERLILADLRSEAELPRLSAGGGTNYDAAFGALLERIPQDVRTLKSQGYRVHRPAVFFLSDGQPTCGEEWRETHRRLTDRAVTPAAPNVIAFGIGEARAGTILAAATQEKFAFVSIPGAQLGESIARFFTALTKSVVESGNAMAAGQPELVVEKPEGFRLAIDEV
ncbi:vWA domain-containing protein [Streptomyces pseudogriseolus]|uniref:vWA domain-containing protein n=1 Tax=Streptomyces pseudogriseolus TaxID=36817 RepID=UPI003FA2119A